MQAIHTTILPLSLTCIHYTKRHLTETVEKKNIDKRFIKHKHIIPSQKDKCNNFTFACPPSNNKGETESFVNSLSRLLNARYNTHRLDWKLSFFTPVQFCNDSEVTSNDIYIDSSETSSRVTNCTCNFGITDETIISIKSTNSQVYNCKTKIQYGDNQSSLFDVCGKVDVKIDIKTSQTYNLILINGKINFKNYCLRLFTGNTIKIKLKCFPNFHETTNSTTSMFIVENQGLPPHILASVVVGCIHKRRQKSLDPKIDQHIYINQSVVQYNVDGNCGEINAYKRNNSKEGDVEEDIAGEFAEIKSTDVRLQRKRREVGGGYEIVQPLTNAQTNSSNQTDKNIHSLASNSHLDQFQSGVVYSSPVKKLKGTNTHVNALPEKTKIKRSQGVSSVSAEVRKLTKNGKNKKNKYSIL
ncbi:hypothetical protein KUTeg_017465 [Tegillarca granosa]|uniref:Uncharacterized protein n=1 Tax=Tegillarca granosa TaxID=220873 RepID=A0ABQ9EJX2_TEGGR|nr:hypothetical protein KUTeg_017465 [Tegillarca granosa]